MLSARVIAIFDIGKTNKKLFLFDEHYNIVWENSRVFDEKEDEDGDPCENLKALNQWIREVLIKSKKRTHFDISAINFSAYGASFVHIGKDGDILTPLYNYLKPYPENVKKQFYDQYGGELTFSVLTASPVLGSLNSGMQLYRIKNEKPDLFERIEYSLHLPQYLSWLHTGRAFSEISSIGCHTNLWNFSQQQYHEWVYREGVISKLPPIPPAATVYPANAVAFNKKDPVFPDLVAGTGLHDSAAAMIPYLEAFPDPFILISTGTWCISMNPFNTQPLTIAELKNDCLCYMTYRGRPMKSSRLFAGYDHEIQAERLSVRFEKDNTYYRTVQYNTEIVKRLHTMQDIRTFSQTSTMVSASVFSQRDLVEYNNFEEAYHRLIMDIMDQQVISTRFLLTPDVKRIFVDGGFGKNPVYMNLLASAFPTVEVFSATINQASAIGAAMAIHPHWNRLPLPTNIVILKNYKPSG
jgi:L-fuculokinase